MKLIDLYFYLLYRMHIELLCEDEKDSKLFAIAFLVSWSSVVLYDCILYVCSLYGLKELCYDIQMYYFWIIFGLIWCIRYYKCKKNITEEFDAKYGTWHPDTRELARIVTIVVLVAPFVTMLFI